MQEAPNTNMNIRAVKLLIALLVVAPLLVVLFIAVAATLRLLS